MRKYRNGSMGTTKRANMKSPPTRATNPARYTTTTTNATSAAQVLRSRDEVPRLRTITIASAGSARMNNPDDGCARRYVHR
jgi:hypothetical protein